MALRFEQLFCSIARTKIIQVLAEEGELNISRLIKKTKLNNNCVKPHLEFLINVGLVQEKDFGRIRIFRFKEENVKARGIKKLIELIENN